MAQSREFPAFISVEYSRDAAGFPAFERDAQATADRARKSFESAYREIGNLAKALRTRTGLDYPRFAQRLERSRRTRYG